MSARYSFSDLPAPVQAQLAAIGPFLFGGVVGFILGESAAGFWILNGLSVAAGVGGGLEHSTLRRAALRGAVTGGFFGTGIVVAHAVSGDKTLATVPSPLALIIVVAAVAGASLATIGCWLATRGR